MDWEPAERVQKNDKGEYRAFINGGWIPVEKAQKSNSGEYRIMRGNTQASPDEIKTATAPQRGQMVTGKIGRAGEITPEPVYSKVISPEATELTFAEKLAQKALNYAGEMQDFTEKSPYLPSVPSSFKVDGNKGFKDQTVNNANDFAAGATSMIRGVGNLIAGEGTFKPPVSPTGAEADKGSFNYIAGQIADPTTWATLKGVDKMPVIGKMLQMQPLKSGQALSGIAKNTGRGAVIGALLGGTSEDGTAKDGAAFGAGLGFGLPIISAGINPAYKYGKNLLQSPDVASGRFANKAANASGRRDLVVKALREADPLSNLNAGQVASKTGSAEFSALQKIADSHNPTIAQSKYGMQEAQRLSTLDSIGKNKQAVEKAITDRASKTKPFYDAVKKSVSSPDVSDVESTIKGIYAENKSNDSIAKPMKEIFAKLKKSKSAQDMKSLSDHIKNLMRKTTDGTPDFDVKVLKTVKDSLDNAITKAEPNYGLAQESYKKLSEPINKMQVGQYLKETLKQPLQIGERDAPFLKAVEDAPKTLKNSTGFARYNDLGQVLDKTESNAVNRVAQALIDEKNFSNLANKGQSATGRIIGEAVAPPQSPSYLSAKVTTLNEALRFLSGKITEKTFTALSNNMQNPRKMAELMEKASASERELINQAMMKYGLVGSLKMQEEGN